MSKLIIVAGVSGSGKTTIGKLLAKKLNLPFEDADDYHPEANVEKMKAGHALNDADREPWLKILAEKLTEWKTQGGVVLACSALKESYRKTLSSKSDAKWVFLDGSFEVLKSRLTSRKNHFFKPVLLHSQIETLEEADYGIHVSIDQTPEEITEKILHKLYF